MTDLTHDTINTWADDQGPVALHLKQKLLPVEGEGGVIFPPTYANIGYNIDTLSDGTKVVTIDSVGSQANRMEPIFKDEPYSSLVPQIAIKYGENQKSVSIFEVGHRLGDAVVRSSGKSEGNDSEQGEILAEQANKAFQSFLDLGRRHQVGKTCADLTCFRSLGFSGYSCQTPRIVQSVIRAWDINPLTRSAQYNPALDYAALEVFSEDEKQKAEGKKESPLAQRGFVHVPATELPGGVVAYGPIERDVTVNLIALRRLNGKGDDTQDLRCYILGLSLVAATAPLDFFLRQGCLLVPDTKTPVRWELVGRDGSRQEADLTEDVARKYAEDVARKFGVEPNKTAKPFVFQKGLAKKDVKKADKKSKAA